MFPPQSPSMSLVAPRKSTTAWPARAPGAPPPRAGATPGRGQCWRGAAALGAGGFLALAAIVTLAGVPPFERALFRLAHATGSDAGAWLRLVNHLGDVMGLLPLGLALALALPLVRRHCLLWLATMAGAGTLEVVFKHVVGRPRPSGSHPGFPSGHVTAAAAFFVLAAHCAGERCAGVVTRALVWVLAAVAVVGVGAARLGLGAHWPLDVLGGDLLGGACAAAAIAWSARHEVPAA